MDRVEMCRRRNQHTRQDIERQLELARQIADCVGAHDLAGIRRARAGLALGAVLFLLLRRPGPFSLHAVAVRHTGMAGNMLHGRRRMLGHGRERDGRHRCNAESDQHRQNTPQFVKPCHEAR